MLGYYELPEEDQPAESIWLDSEALAGHFENVKARRKNPQSSGGAVWEDIPDMTENDAQADEIRRIRGGR